MQILIKKHNFWRVILVLIPFVLVLFLTVPDLRR